MHFIIEIYKKDWEFEKYVLKRWLKDINFFENDEKKINLIIKHLDEYFKGPYVGIEEVRIYINTHIYLITGIGVISYCNNGFTTMQPKDIKLINKHHIELKNDMQQVSLKKL